MKRLRHALRRLHKVSRLHIAVIALVIVNILLGAWLFMPQSAGRYQEIESLKGKNLSFKELSMFFSTMANDKGGEYAFEALKRAQLPPNIDLHLLGHVVGDVFYKQKGSKAILSCTPDFRNACSHTIVVGTLLEKGPGSLSEIADLCRQAPGGPGAYGMCFHGLGHGVLAYNEYDLKKGVEMCKKTASAGGGPEYVECTGGMIMEMIAGVHDREAWEKMAPVYFKKADPLYPCSGSVIPEETKSVCYTYLTPHLFQAAGAELAAPKPEHFKKAFTYCNNLTGISRMSCFGGFGKEFVVLAQDRDIRNIGNMSTERLKLVIDWCNLATPKDGKDLCIRTGLNSLFWGGENDPGASVRYCTLADAGKKDGECFPALYSLANHFIRDPLARQKICDLVPEDHSRACKDSLI
jgi:hypothetical protein